MQKLLCVICKNYLDEGTCLAFPNGIPQEILTGEGNHAEPLPGQGNNFVFEELNDNDARLRPNRTA